MKKKYVILFVLFVCLVLNLSAYNDTPSYLNYIKNNGQWNSKVLYQADFRGGKLFLEKNAFTYLFYPQDGLRRLHPHQETNSSTGNEKISSNSGDGITLNFHVVKMEFIGSAENTQTVQLNKKPFYHNYYIGKDASKWADNVPISEGVMYNDLYHGISLKAFSNNNDFRYDLTVNPGTNPAILKMKFTGQDNLSIQDGKLIISTSVGEITQNEPYAYQEEAGKQTKVNCKYVLKENIVSIEVAGNYNHNLPLIIDPTLVFATFTGSTADNWGMSASYDNQGNGYTAGICFDTGYPLTTGSFQQTFAGGQPITMPGGWTLSGFDIVTSKFDATGSNLLFSTYLGGSDNEEPQSIIVDNGNNLLILGRSYSSNFPVTAGAYDVSLNGGADIFITKFNATGTALIGSTFVGGSGDDGVNYAGTEQPLGSTKYNYADDGRGDIILDSNNNVYIASCTQSSDFPVTAGCAQSVSGGMQDGCVFKLNPNLTSLIWSTYLGGSANDAAYNLAIDNNNSVYTTGGTESSDFPISSGAFISTYGGNIDGFLTHLSPNGNALLQSTYIGTAGYDQSYFVQLDVSNNVYIYGQTSGGYPVTPGVYSNPNSGQFIHAFNSTLSSTIFSTVFGTGQGAPDIVPSAFLVDKCNNIYISGWGGDLGGSNNSNSTTKGLPVTANAFQPQTDGMDFYFMVLKPIATALWYATYFGGDSGSEEHVDGGTSRFDKSGVIYQAICEGCAVNPSTGYQVNQDMPTTPTAWSTTDKSFNCNNALVKFSFDLIKAQAALNINPTSAKGCTPFSVSFTNQSQNSTDYIWSFGDGTSSNSINATHTYTTPGTYSVSLVAIDSAVCYSIDTIISTITVYPLPTVTVNSPTICAGASGKLIATGASTYTWSIGSYGTSITESPNATTQYTVTGANIDGCVNTATTTIHVNPLPTVGTVGSSTICVGDTSTITVSGALTYTWNTSAHTDSIVVFPTVTTNYTVTGTDTNNCKNIATATVTVNPLPILTINHPAICIGTTTTLTAGGASTYIWNTGSNTASFSETPTITTNYTVTGTNSNGCVNTKTTSITVYDLPTVTASNDTICLGNNATLSASGAATYVWSSGNTGATVVLSPTITTDYTVTGTDNHQCVNTATLNVLVYPVLPLAVTNATICAGNTATLTASGGTTYTWSTSEVAPTITVSVKVPTQFTVSSSNGLCTNSKVSTVTTLVNHTDIASLTADVCLGDSLKLYTTTTYTAYNWSTGQTTPTIEITTPGIYYVTTIDTLGCKGVDTIKVGEDAPVAIPLKNYTICEGDSVQLSTTAGLYTYQWYPPNGLSSTSIYNPFANPTQTTTYLLSLINGACVTNNTLTVFVNPIPSLSVHPKTSLVLQGESVTLFAVSKDSCVWTTPNWLSCSTCNTTVSAPDADIIYTVTATNNYGCTNVATATVQVDIEATLYIPNCFTPNGDGLNDIFKPLGINITDLTLLVFDRWGLQIFETTDIDQGWDGTYKGTKCQEDVYVYKLQYTDIPKNKKHTLSGHVSIVR